jgi:serine protease AprX
MVSGAAALILDKHPGASPDEVKKLLTSTGYGIVGKSQAIGGGELQLATTLVTPVPSSTQTWPSSDGSGKLELSRGTDHLTLDGVELNGEQDIFGQHSTRTRWRLEASAAVGRVSSGMEFRPAAAGRQLVEWQLPVRFELVRQ